VALDFQFLVSDKHSVKRSSSVIIADLQADANLGLGITVSTVDGGGIVVQSMMKNGPAERDGRLHVGDHINSIDGHSLEGATQADADQLIRQLQGHVRIVASRPLLSPDVHLDRVSDTGSLNGGRQDLSSSQILKHASMDESDPNLVNVPSPEMNFPSAKILSVTAGQLTTAEDHNSPGGTAGLFVNFAF